MNFALRISSPQKTADLVTFTEEIPNGKLHFLCSDSIRLLSISSSRKFINVIA